MRLRRVVLALKDDAGAAPVNARAADVADLVAIVEIDAEAFVELPYPAFFLRQSIDAFGGLLRVVEQPRGEVAGYALGVMTAGEPTGWILSMAVRPERRRTGVAAALLSDIEERLAACGAGRVLLTVEPDNAPARRLYARHGYIDVRDEPDYFGPGEWRVVMEKGL